MAKPTPAIDLRPRGVTLMESLIASVVLSVAVVGIAGTLVATSQQAQDVDDSTVVNSLARELMEEVIAKPFAVPTSGDVGGWSTGNKDRKTYDNVADFHGYADTSPFQSIGGRSIDPGTGQSYIREVQFEYRSTPSLPYMLDVGELDLLGLLDGVKHLLLDPKEVLIGAAYTAITSAAATPTQALPEFGFVCIKVASSSGKYVIINRLVCNTTYKK